MEIRFKTGNKSLIIEKRQNCLLCTFYGAKYNVMVFELKEIEHLNTVLKYLIRAYNWKSLEILDEEEYELLQERIKEITIFPHLFFSSIARIERIDEELICFNEQGNELAIIEIEEK